MLDFVMISTKSSKRGVIDIYPKFIIKNSEDLMIRGGDFYAIWIEEKALWSTNEQDAINLIDKSLDEYYEKNKNNFDSNVRILHMWDAESGMIDAWHKYCQKQLRDSFNVLDEKLIFSNEKITKKDYASKQLPYPLESGSTEAWDTLVNVLYSEEEKRKIEWAIGAVVTGDSKKIQKFLVFYGSAGTGKSTILNIIQMLFEGYYSVFDAKALGSSSNAFALEAFKTNPLVAIQHDGDLSKIEDNTRLNSLVSHELMTVNEKFKSTYASRFKSFLFMGTNKPVKITDGRSGIIRRLIDISPTGNKVSQKEYKKLMNQITFELGAIASHCKDVYLEDPSYYDTYIPVTMLGASNDFYNFVIDSYHVFKRENGTTLKAAWEMYKTYCDDANVTYPFSQRIFKEELKNYFWEFEDRFSLEDGSRVRSYYYNFRTDKFETPIEQTDKPEKESDWLEMGLNPSQFDILCTDCIAQYANESGTPMYSWGKVKTTLNDINTSKLHWVKPEENHIVIDFDIPDENGEKSFSKNFEAASKWPKTYAEVSKSGKGIHLHYIYTGDTSKLSSVYDDHIEIKVFTGKSSLRRMLTRCNQIPVSTLSSGLPLRSDKKTMVNFEAIKNEKELRAKIKKALRKEVHAATRPNIDFIDMLLTKAYDQKLNYDVSDMESDIFIFAANSTHQSDYCMKRVAEMKFKSDDISPDKQFINDDIVFFDCEVFPNLFLVNWKVKGSGKKVVRMINPSPTEIEELLKFKLVGFNCRNYDNHILYARLLGYTNEQLYQLSSKIVNEKKGNASSGKFGEAYNLSYTDIYDFASAGNKKSLKKLEIEMGIHHKELGLPWDKPVPEERWEEVAEYCDNDVIATEEAFKYLNADWTARQILADIAGGSVNDTTNQLSTKFIFEGNKKPQGQFNYRFMGDPSIKTHRSPIIDDTVYANFGDEYTVFDDLDRPVFPGYTFDSFRKDKSIYRGEVAGEGGFVYAEVGYYRDVALLDIASMHPSSIIAENLFGDYYTRRFADIRDARVLIKHGEFEKAKQMFDGKLSKYLTDKETADSLANALKTVINSVYGLTSAGFENPFRDPRNVDNIVAKRGALFMINLKNVVQQKGFKVAHIKTDSIKIPNATPEIIQFVMDYGKMYGYTFEHEATYDRMCLINDAVYIAKYKNADSCNDLYGYIPDKNKKKSEKWDATGAQFAVPYVFKTLFSKEPIEFDDLCETKSVTSALYLDMNESLGPDEHDYVFVGKCGQFCPILPGSGGGNLVRINENKKTGEIKYDSAVGCKDYRWLESEFVKSAGLEKAIDKGFYRALVDKAKDEIEKYVPFDVFISNEVDDVPWYTDEEIDNFKKR